MLDSAAAKGWRPIEFGSRDRPRRELSQSSGPSLTLEAALPIETGRKLARPAFADSGIWVAPEWELGERVKQATVSPRVRQPSEETELCTPPGSPRQRAFGSTSPEEGQSEFVAAISDALEHQLENLDLSGRAIDAVPPQVGDLRKIVRLSHLITPSTSASTVTRGRTGHVSLSLHNNALTADSISPALWRCDNLKLLSLRRNQLDSLPPSVGLLSNLSELSVGGNAIVRPSSRQASRTQRYLPHELNALRLDVFTVTPNPFLSPPTPDTTLTPVEAAGRSVLPTLRELCTRALLRPAEYKPAPRTFTRANSSSRALEPANETGPRRVIHDRAGFDLEAIPAHLRSTFRAVLGDLTATLPNVCPNPRCGRAYIEPIVTRMQWTREVAGVTLPQAVPIKWRGCSNGCLGFLDPPTL